MVFKSSVFFFRLADSLEISLLFLPVKDFSDVRNGIFRQLWNIILTVFSQSPIGMHNKVCSEMQKLLLFICCPCDLRWSQMAQHSHHTGHLIITFNHQTHTLFTGVVTVLLFILVSHRRIPVYVVSYFTHLHTHTPCVCFVIIFAIIVRDYRCLNSQRPITVCLANWSECQWHCQATHVKNKLLFLYKHSIYRFMSA